MAKLGIKKQHSFTKKSLPMLESLEIGDLVKWKADNNSDTYVVKEVMGNIVFLTNEEGNEVEALRHEVEKVWDFRKPKKLGYLKNSGVIFSYYCWVKLISI